MIGTGNNNIAIDIEGGQLMKLFAFLKSQASPKKPLIDDTVKYRKGIIPAVKECNLWKGDSEEKIISAKRLLEMLSTAYGVTTPQFEITKDESIDGGSSKYNPATKTITLINKWSLLSLLYELGHARYGAREDLALWWSVNLFRKAYPSEFEKLKAKGHRLLTENKKK